MKKVLILPLLLILSLMVTQVLAEDGIGIVRYVLGGGASDSTISGGGISLQATLGQPIVGVVDSSGGDLTIGQGFWIGRVLSDGGYDIYLPLILR
ncbi:MAG: hypothetical protein JXA42_25960 [Anaerolineales bacterium]|nr:hypothetical protein [Anaerolineales bacterium]